jgi:hypothetical protein
MSPTSNSSHAWGTGTSSGHTLEPKQDSAAWERGQRAKAFAPSTCSVWRYPFPISWKDIPRVSAWNCLLSRWSRVMGPKPAMNRTLMFGLSVME